MCGVVVDVSVIQHYSVVYYRLPVEGGVIQVEVEESEMEQKDQITCDIEFIGKEAKVGWQAMRGQWWNDEL